MYVEGIKSLKKNFVKDAFTSILGLLSRIGIAQMDGQ